MSIAMFVSVMRIDVSSATGWVSRKWYFDVFNQAYYATVLVQHTHNNPVLITFFELMFLVTQPANSNPDLDDEDRVKLNR